MIRYCIVTFILLSGTMVFAQQRIGLEIGTRFTNLNLTVNYQKVLKSNLLLNAGAFYGGLGESLLLHDTMRLYTGKPIHSPFPQIDLEISDSSSSYKFLDYKSRARAIGVQFGLGYFYEFGVVHGLKFNIISKIGYVRNKVSVYYRSISAYTEKYKPNVVYHFYTSICPELYHTIRYSGRVTFLYGIKLPYHFSVDKTKFNPQNPKDLLFGFEPELCLGLTFVIGKCD